jgi:hypothetical protein
MQNTLTIGHSDCHIVRRNMASREGIIPMTTLLARRSTARDLLQELRAFFRSLIVADVARDDAASTGFSWPRGL